MLLALLSNAPELEELYLDLSNPALVSHPDTLAIIGIPCVCVCVCVYVYVHYTDNVYIHAHTTLYI